MSTLPPFHLAFPVHDLDAARTFYGDLLGCKLGRSSDQWQDFDFHGHQIVAHLGGEPGVGLRNPVDGHAVPVPHFGLILPCDVWQSLADRLQQAGVEFVIEPYLRFEGQPSEQGTFFLYDPSGNALEFKCFKDMEQVFAA